jgi:hypothetical protein
VLARCVAGNRATPVALLRVRRLIAMFASLIAFLQNFGLIAFGVKDGVIIPLLLPCAVEVGLCWLGYSVVRNTGRSWILLAGWCAAVLVVAELLLPVTSGLV